MNTAPLAPQTMQVSGASRSTVWPQTGSNGAFHKRIRSS